MQFQCIDFLSATGALFDILRVCAAGYCNVQKPLVTTAEWVRAIKDDAAIAKSNGSSADVFT